MLLAVNRFVDLVEILAGPQPRPPAMFLAWLRKRQNIPRPPS